MHSGSRYVAYVSIWRAIMEKGVAIPPKKQEQHRSVGVTLLILYVTQWSLLLRPAISTTIISNEVKLGTTMKCGKKLEIFVLTAISISALMILWVQEPF